MFILTYHLQGDFSLEKPTNLTWRMLCVTVGMKGNHNSTTEQFMQVPNLSTHQAAPATDSKGHTFPTVFCVLKFRL